MTRQIKTATGAALLAAITAVPAAAELKWENASGGYVQIYGQVSPAWQSVDDGVQSKDTFVDNAHSNTRVGLWVVQPMYQGTFKFNLETALGLRSSGGVSQTNTPKGADWDRTDLRKIDFSYASESWGTIYVGQGSMASDGVADITLNNNGMTTYNAIGDFAGSFQFRTAAGALSGVTIGSVNPSLDGGRQGRVRYDTPSFNGFTVSVAAGTDVLTPGNSDKYYDIALKYAGEFDGTKVKGGIGFSRRDSGGVDRDDTFGSVAVKFRSGLNFAVAGGSRENSGDYTYVLAGYETQFLSVGMTSFAVDYYNGNDFGLAGRESKSLGLGINQNFDSINTQVYLGYRNHELSDPGTAYQDVDAFLFGARWKF
ncbi:porin [Ruegeria pomeroyi]|uniref:Porin n=1 Tax=Ruegeria pomeroyi TaxID=89184 RepID=A0A9Q3ZKR9_9RHOB|nr:porin [Ruegeria pomeroyi]MCE8536235.1 porin [Ruegeria pomeroyi]